MIFRILLHFDIDARDDLEAVEAAKKLEESLKSPFVKMSLETDGIRPVGQAVVYAPQRT